MRICHIVPSIEGRHGGPSKSVRAVANGLAAAGHEVELLTTAESAVASGRDRAVVRIFPRTRPKWLCRSPRMAAHLAAGKYDCIHNHALWLLPLRYAHATARASGTPLVIAPRGMMSPWSWQHRRWKKFLAGHCVHPGALAQAAGWHATSEEEAADIRRLGFTQPVCVAPNGVDIPDASVLIQDRQYWHERCPQLRDRRVALFYSRFHPKKRILELIELWAHHAPADWVLFTVGIPETYDVAAINDHARRCGVASRVLAFDGTDVPAPYAAASVYLLPSHSENFGLTVAEAMAHGLPVVTTDATPWRGLDGQGAGRCVPWAAFGPTMNSMLGEDSVGLEARGARGRAWMQTEYSWAKSAAILASFYRTLPGIRSC